MIRREIREIRELKYKSEKLEARFWMLIFGMLIILVGVFEYHSQSQAEIRMLRSRLTIEQVNEVDRAMHYRNLEEL